jgi:hypothetical protein
VACRARSFFGQVDHRSGEWKCLKRKTCLRAPEESLSRKAPLKIQEVAATVGAGDPTMARGAELGRTRVSGSDLLLPAARQLAVAMAIVGRVIARVADE